MEPLDRERRIPQRRDKKRLRMPSREKFCASHPAAYRTECCSAERFRQLVIRGNQISRRARGVPTRRDTSLVFALLRIGILSRITGYFGIFRDGCAGFAQGCRDHAGAELSRRTNADDIAILRAIKDSIPDADLKSPAEALSYVAEAVRAHAATTTIEASSSDT